jgi:hypothetical protein
MDLFVLGMRRSGTTILYDALREDAELRCFYEPLREEDVTEGGGSGARRGDAFAETRAIREAYRAEHHPDVPIELFNWGGPRAPELEVEPGLPPHVEGFLRHLLAQAPAVAIKETRLHHKVPALARIAPDAIVVHLVRDPRAVASSMLLGRRRRLDLYPDAAAFFTARSGRRLWSSRVISDLVVDRMGFRRLPFDLPDFIRPLLVWKAAFETTYADGARLFGRRYVLVRLEDLRAAPGPTLERIYSDAGRTLPDPVAEWAAANIRPKESTAQHPSDPRWAAAARAISLDNALEVAGYPEILELDPNGECALDLEPPPPPSRLSALLRRSRRRLQGR